MTDAKYMVDFEPVGKRVEVKPGMTIMDAARQVGLPLTSDCGGEGSCGQCRIIARDQTRLGKPSLAEEGMLEEDELAAGYRMACQTEILGDVKIEIPVASLTSGQRLQVESASQTAASAGSFDDLVVQSFTIQVPEATLHDLRSDIQRVINTIEAEHHLSDLTAHPPAVRMLSPLLRKYHWQVTALVRGSTIVGFLAPGERPVGLAVDLGTTKVAAYLVDLTSGETIAAEGRPNPQIGYGEDVVSRLVYAMNKAEGSKILSQAVYNTLHELAVELAGRANIPLTSIAEACIVGNTAMTHLLLELPVAQLALAPYVSAAASPQEVRAADMGLPFTGDARVYVPSCVAGYVGADLVAMTLASRIGQDDRTVLGVDIGTNTEIVLAIGGTQRMIALSCASGPAFEGAHIRAGMRAAAGAIERVWLDHGTKALVQTIDNIPAVGICGSGIIDAVAELRRIGAVNTKGRFQADFPGVRSGRGGLEYVLVSAPETSIGEDITITQHDVDEIQFAKGAILAGITVLLEVGGLKFEDLDEVVLAGAFGTFLNLDTAVAVGLLPDVPLERYRQVGNAAGDGARQILVSKTARQAAVDLAHRIEYVELTIYPGFRRIYARSMMLNH